MEFVDNTGHIFSLPSYKEKPIGYEYDEYSYIFWIDSVNSSKLSVNNYYSKPIYALYELDEDFPIKDLEDDENSPLDIEIYVKESNVFKLIASKDFQEYLSSDKYNDLNDYVDLNKLDHYTFIKERLTNEDLFTVKTNEQLNESTSMNYLMIPIYPICTTTETGTWITNIMIHITDKRSSLEEWCYVSVGGEFVDEYEELVINGQNNGVKLPKDIIKAVYAESLYNDEFNESLYNEKLKEYLMNIMGIKGECGNFNSAIKSIKWFGYGDKLSLSKLLKTDNAFKSQYIHDYFNISNDVITSFKTFATDSLISLMIMLNKELNELYKFEPEKDFYGENKPKMVSLLDSYVKIKIGNHDMPIEEDDEKYWYWKPYFDFSFMELGIKLMCLKYFYKKYFLPIHLQIHSATLGYRVFANDVKLTGGSSVVMSYPSIAINNKEREVEFLGKGIHYFTKQIHFIDNYFNEFRMPSVNSDSRTWYYMDDTCVNIPIRFIQNEWNKGYYNCVLLLQFKDDNRTLYESHFSFVQNNEYEYKNFIIYPKKFNVQIFNERGQLDVKSNYFDYWINRSFIIRLLVNNRWYEYEFELKINKPTIDFGKLKYRYYLNEHNYLISKIRSYNENHGLHSIVYADQSAINKIAGATIRNDCSTPLAFNNELYRMFGSDGDNDSVFINTIDFSNEEQLYQYFMSNYNVYSPFKQLKALDKTNKKVSFNAYMHKKGLATMNEIDFDINFYKILQYHLDNNLMYIDGTLLDNEFYQYIIYNYNGKEVEVVIHKDLIGEDISVPQHYFNTYDNIMVCAWQDNLLVLSESGVNDNAYVLHQISELYIMEETADEDEDPNYLAFDSYDFEYNKETRSYWKDGKEYFIYDKLHTNTESIYTKYTSLVNLPNNLKYKNNLHLFGIYKTAIEEHNVLFFRNNIHLYANGIRFDHDKYTASQYEERENDSLKFYISDNLSEDVDTRYIDIYSLEWLTDEMEIPQEIISTIDQYGLYVGRDYSLYFTEGEDHIDNVWELPDAEKYYDSEFTYYIDSTSTKLCSAYYNTLDDFYSNKNAELEDCEYEDITLYIKNNKYYYFRDPSVIDLSDASKGRETQLSYTVNFVDENGELKDVMSLRDIEAGNYSKVKINFTYKKTHIVRNRFYMLSEYIANNLDKNPRIYEENGEYYFVTDITANDPIKLIKFKEKYRYYDVVAQHEILNQNPAMYWYNADKESIESLPSYLNELERFAYDATKQGIDEIKAYLDSYIAKNQESRSTGTYIDDSNEVLFRYVNYLEKDLTGWIGTYRMELESNIDDGNEIRLLTEIIKADGSVVTYSTPDGNTFTLTGKEQKVTLFIQIINNIDMTYYQDDVYFIPKLIKITELEERLKYDAEQCGAGDNPTIAVKFLNKEYVYGNNESEYVYDLYNDFFSHKLNIYDSYIENGKVKVDLLESIYEANDKIKLNSWLTYDFYLMHDDQYWYGLYISRQTCDNIRTEKDLLIDKSNKKMTLKNKKDKSNYIIRYERSSQEYLINRLDFISSNGINHFKDDDIICCYIHNNNVLPFSSSIGSKWSVSPMSIGMHTDMNYESNGELTVISLPTNSSKYQRGYYKVTVRYSLDRDLQHQFKNTSTISVQ